MFHLFSAQDKYDEEALSKWLLRCGRCGATRHNHELLRTLFIVSPLRTAPGYCKVFRSREPQPVLPGRPGVIGGYRGCCAEPPTPNESAPVKSAWCMSVAVCLSSHCLSVASTSRQSRSSHLAHSFVPFPHSLPPSSLPLGSLGGRTDASNASGRGWHWQRGRSVGGSVAYDSRTFPAVLTNDPTYYWARMGGGHPNRPTDRSGSAVASSPPHTNAVPSWQDHQARRRRTHRAPRQSLRPGQAVGPLSKLSALSSIHTSRDSRPSLQGGDMTEFLPSKFFFAEMWGGL